MEWLIRWNREIFKATHKNSVKSLRLHYKDNPINFVVEKDGRLFWEWYGIYAYILLGSMPSFWT
jgi:hypothetical protein